MSREVFRQKLSSAVLDFNSVYREYAHDVRRFALFLSGDASAADDIVSETFVRLWNARSRVDLTTVKAYLFAIARNLFLQQRRHANRREELNAEHHAKGPDPERQTQTNSELQSVLAALQELPELDRAAA